MATTIKDVARVAGVSVASVSRALNGSANITALTRERILKAVAELRFTPSSAARSLITRRTHTVGAVLPTLHGEYFSSLLNGVEQGAQARGLHLLLACSQREVPGATAAALKAMRGRVDGLLVMSLHADRCSAPFGINDELRSVLHDVPAVFLGTRIDSDQHASFSVDNRGGAQAMTRHLIARGHHRIAFITGPLDNIEARERLDGHREALTELLPGTEPLLIAGDFSEASGWRAGCEIAALTKRPSAVFASNDLMAIGAASAFADVGLRVPNDIALAGFDDIAVARYLTPPLTTVRVRVAELGALALDRLAAMIESPDRQGPTHRTIPAELIVRQSCARGAAERTPTPSEVATPSPQH